MKIRYLRNVSEDSFTEAVKNSHCKGRIAELLIGYYNSPIGREINFLLEEYGLDTSHFDRNKKNRRYEIILKECPICKNEFEVLKDHPKEKVTCSVSCANSFFRSGVNNPNWKSIQEYEEEMRENPELRKSPFYYRKVCFHYHEPICIICGEENIVATHHYDEDKNNYSPDNLIPLCPTHHQYLHSGFAHLIKDRVEKYRNQFINKQNSV